MRRASQYGVPSKRDGCYPALVLSSGPAAVMAPCVWPASYLCRLAWSTEQVPSYSYYAALEPRRRTCGKKTSCSCEVLNVLTRPLPLAAGRYWVLACLALSCLVLPCGIVFRIIANTNTIPAHHHITHTWRIHRWDPLMDGSPTYLSGVAFSVRGTYQGRVALGIQGTWAERRRKKSAHLH